MREAYRLQKSELLYPAVENKPFGLALAIQYVGNEVADYALMHKRMADVLTKLGKETS